MVRKLLLSILALTTLSGINAQEFTVWESRAEFPSDWSHFEEIQAATLRQFSGFNTVNIYYDDMFAGDNSWASIFLYDGSWANTFKSWSLSIGSDPYPTGSLKTTLTPEQISLAMSNGLIIQGCHFSLTKVTVSSEEPPRYIHDMIWGENSGFEAPQSGWTTWGTHFDAIQAVDYGNGYNSDTAMQLVNTSEGEIWENRFQYVFPETLAPGKYKLEFNAKSDIATGSLLVSLTNSANYSGVKFHNVTTGTDWSKIEAEFEISEGEKADALVIQFGKEKGSFYIDDVHFGPYLESEPDKLLLWSGNGQNSGYAGLINPSEIYAGDIIRLTFSQDAKPFSDIINITPVALFHAKLHQNGIADPAVCDITDGILEIGVTDEMLYNLKTEGIVFELPSSSPRLVKIERVVSKFNSKGVIAYGNHDTSTCDTRNIYTYPMDSDDKIAVMFTSNPTSVILSTGTDYSVKIGDLSTALSRVRADGSTVMVFDLTPEIIEAIRSTGHFRIKSDAGFKYVYTNPTMDVPGVNESHDLVWDKAMKISGWTTYMKLPAGVFSHVSAGDKIYFHVDDAASDTGYGIITMMYGDWEQFSYYNFLQSELNPDGLCRVEITLDDEQAGRLKSEGMLIAGDGFTLSQVSIESAIKPDDNLFYGFYQFYGTWDEKYSQPFTIPADRVNAGDVIRIHFAWINNNFNHLIPYTDNNNNVSGTVNWIMDHGYHECYQDMGITNQFIESCSDNILLHGSYMINKVEILRDRFDPTDMLAYGTTEHSNTNISVKIPHNATALEITFDDVEIDGPKELTFYPTPGDDTNNLIFEEESFICSDGLCTVTVDLTPELINMINEKSYGQLSLKCALPFRYMKAVIDPTLSIDGIDTDNSAEVEYYNLQGVRVSEPATGGIYIRRQGSTTEKILIK